MEPYEPPVITKLQSGQMNKFGRSSGYARKVRRAIDGVTIDDLVSRYGSPLYVFSEQKIRKLVRECRGAFSRRYPNVTLAWSYKTNYLDAICSIMHQEGSLAEVVSEMEYAKARALGVPGEQIIFNGPFKPYDGLKQAIVDGAIVNIDNMDELYDIEKIVTETGTKAQIGIRVNMALGAQMAWDRFGFNVDGGQAHQAVKRIFAGGKATLVGIHAHVGTFILEPETYRQEAQKLIAFSSSLKEEFGLTISYLDIGGGFASRNRLKGTYLSTAEMIPSFDAYAEAVCSELLDAFTPEELPLLFLESGRAMIDEAGSLIATVQATKRLANGMKGVVIDAGVNLLFTSFWYDHEIIPTVDRGYPQEDHVIYGPLCMNIDCIQEDASVPALKKGDRVVLMNVGAYTMTQWMQFITFRPAIVLITADGSPHVIRKAESLEYVMSLEEIPPSLRSLSA